MYGFESLTEESEDILLALFSKKHIYTKRLSLLSLSKHRYHDIVSLIKELWRKGDEWARVDCLECLKNSSKDFNLFNKYFEILSHSNDKYIQYHVKRLADI